MSYNRLVAAPSCMRCGVLWRWCPQIYNPQKGGFTDVGMLDVQQIFGRAGRPQFEDSGEPRAVRTT